MSEAEKNIRTITGQVVSNKADKTITAVSYTHLTLPTNREV